MFDLILKNGMFFSFGIRQRRGSVSYNSKTELIHFRWTPKTETIAAGNTPRVAEEDFHSIVLFSSISPTNCRNLIAV